MKTIYTYLFSALLLLAFTACQKQSEQLLLGGSGWNKLASVDNATRQVVWEHPLEKGWE